MRISVCIPMYNESAIIADTARTLHTYLSEKFGDDFELIFSDDGSKDGSRDIVNSLNLPCVKAIGYEQNKGKGHAVRYGISHSIGDIVLFTDADLAYGVDVICEAVDILENQEYDLLVGSRARHKEGYEGYTFIRRLASKTYIKILNVIAGIKISDSQCGFKAFKGDVGRKIFSHCTVNNFAFDLEVILLAQKMGLEIYQMPVKIINHRDSKVNVLVDAVKMLKEIKKIKKSVKEANI